MKARFVLACAAAGIAASAFVGPVASADQFSGTIGFSPAAVEPGYEVDIIGTCTDPNFTTAPISSLVLEPAQISGHDDGIGGTVLSARAKVKLDAKPDLYAVRFPCGTEPVVGYLRVVAEPESPAAAISVVPTKGVAGTKVTVNVICVDLAPINSTALSLGEATPVEGGGENRPYFAVTGKVKNVKPGTYSVTSRCGGGLISTKFTVLASKAAPVKAQVPVKPKRAPETGGGDA
jgi:hypothetical protein